MASQTSGAIVFGFAAVFSCLHLLEEATTQMQEASHSCFAQVAAAALIPAVVTTFGLTQLLLVSHVRTLGAGEDAGHRFLRHLAKATLLAATAALLAGAVTCLVASGYLGGWPHTHRKK